MPRGNPTLAIAMGARIAARRRELGLTQEQAAERAGITYQQYNKAERGKTCVSSDTLSRLSTALDISADYLLNGKTWEQRYGDVSGILDEMTANQRHFASKILQDLLEFSRCDDETQSFSSK